MTELAQDAGARLRKHFSGISPAEFLKNVDRYAPEAREGTDQGLAEGAPPQPRQFLQFQPHPAPLRLSAYLSSALSGLNSEQRQLVFQASDVVATICEHSNIELYEPRRKTDPVLHPEAPGVDVWKTNRERVVKSDLVIHLRHYPGAGSGEEIDFAYNALVPTILIWHSDTTVSSMVTGIPGMQIHMTYAEPEDLRYELTRRLTELRPVLEERKLAFSQFDANLIGSNVRALRENLGLTREEVAAAGVPLDMLRLIEDSTDREANPSLLHLRQLAAILRTTVADLVEPDLDGRFMVTLQEWARQRATGDSKAARLSGMSPRDRNKLIRRILLRVLDSLEEEDEHSS